jgi:SSS family transporter
MNTTLLSFVILYLLGTMAIGMYAGKRIKNTSDFALAGRSLPVFLVITTTFATWFGAETVMGAPAKFIQGGLNAVIEEPIGAGLCLVLVGAFFASKLYKMNLLTIGDYYRTRYGKSVEIFCSIIIILSYLGWVAAQITALGLVFSILSGGAITPAIGMIIGTALVLIYVLVGGMLAVAWTDLIQMIVLVVGLSVIAMLASEQAGGVGEVVSLASAQDWFNILPDTSAAATAESLDESNNWVWFVAAAVTMMFGSIPQQDVFQRVMSAKSSEAARTGTIIGGVAFLVFAMVPIFIVTSAMLIMPEQTAALLAEDSQRILPTLVLTKMPLIAQILFFGALVSAIKSTSSATLLAPSTSFVENILKNLHPGMSDRQLLLAMRLTVVAFTSLVLTYSIAMEGTKIYELVSMAYQVPLVGAFVPLTFGLYWKRATTQGALASIVLGVGALVVFNAVDALGSAFPGQLAGLLLAVVGMVAGSLLPQWLSNRHLAVTPPAPN